MALMLCDSAGDLRRAQAAAERLCLLIGDEAPWERRDAAVLLLHAGNHSQALAELNAYRASEHFRSRASSAERSLADRLHSLLRSQPGETDFKASSLCVECHVMRLDIVDRASASGEIQGCNQAGSAAVLEMPCVMYVMNARLLVCRHQQWMQGHDCGVHIGNATPN